MQGAIARVCMVVVAAILNHPLLFPNENTTVPEQDEDLLARMKEHQAKLEAEQKRLEQEISQTEKAVIGDLDGYGWYFWSALCLVIFFTIEVCRQDIIPAEVPDPAEDEDGDCSTGYLSAKTITLDRDVLNNFCKTRFHPYVNESGRVREFIEGFADDLLEALRSICDQESDLEVEDFVGIGSMFESWRVSKPPTCDLIVPFSPPQPFRFQFELWCDPSTEIPLDLQGCGRIQLIKPGGNGTDCLCGSTDLGDDMLCLLHNRNECEILEDNALPELLCARDTAFLSKGQIMRWFQISVSKAWGQISHKYDFELAFRNLDFPGALKVKFRSGKTVVLNLTPAVQFENTDAYLLSHFPSDTSNSSDTHWQLSLSVYEKNLLKHLAKSLPTNSCHIHCLQIVSFLHKKQTTLTGRSALSSYHIKTALLHLLLSKRPAMWQPQNLDSRLRDLLSFLQQSLEEKRLYHAVVGNPHIPVEILVPKIIRTAEPINLFRPLVLQRHVYAKMEEHFEEMVRNTSVLVQEYTSHFSNGHVRHEFSSAEQI
ncbi:inositol 1,4,5-trisphosphate receptor-interacting protein [Danio aesculapii]|uniref:inositol 1,4,5-trisphosphate receptor-interacting protein n=1 Tax=Danio aesculapii TaxID=1142201 RepID=UPI0024C01612|nr:inositol 1,4,5-trisphosphate receptor-interacting protein [Danio aesculapii]XP_056327061.1 inositol 1,4,5-trisphosphate receptor-interacting protein [Danio aesculapii]